MVTTVQTRVGAGQKFTLSSDGDMTRYTQTRVFDR